MAENRRIKVAGYAKRIFFNDNIEYRNFSPDLVGFQLTSEGGTTLFTNGNFSISANLDPKPNILFEQGAKSKLYTLDDVVSNDTQESIEKNLKVRLNNDITDPLTYIWYGSAKELLRVSLLDIEDNWPAAIYVDNKVGSVTGNNITEYTYNIENDESTFKVNSNFFTNPYNINYTLDSKYFETDSGVNSLRNLTINYGSYVIEHNGISKNIKGFTGSTQKTNSEVTLIVDGNPFPELTGIYIPQYSFLLDEIDASIPYFIKPNENETEKFFTGLNDLERNILNRDVSPIYTSQFIFDKYTDEGVLITVKEFFKFPILSDGYNLNFFDSFYLSYLEELTDMVEDLDEIKTDTIIRKYATEAITSFDTLPKPADDDYTINGEKATQLLRIYGVEFDYVKKYINGIKFAHVVTYDKKNNVSDSLVKDLAFMLGIEAVDFINDVSFSKLYLPSNGEGSVSGSPTNLNQSEIENELYRRLILNVAWLWKSKGSRKAVEFLFRFIGAPESLVNFNEYIVLVDKPLDVGEIKRLLYLYTGETDLSNIPYDSNGYPLPPKNGELVITDFFDTETGQIVENDFTEMYFQKAGGWYRETYGSNVITVLKGNNPHIGPYDGGSEYLQYFSRCYVPNFDNEPSVVLTARTLSENYFLNYNYGIFNGIPSGTTDFHTTPITFNLYTGQYQPINDCVDITYSIIETPLQNDGKTTLQQAFAEAETQYNDFLQQIQQDSYLIYSPEWQVIKNNYELSLRNCLTEIETEDCDINQTLEICLTEPIVDSTEFSCDELTLSACSPFYYYVNDDNVKVSFDEFQSCCTQISKDNQYVSYINEQGRLTEYCSAKAPCIGEPSLVLDDGIVVFDVNSNSLPREGVDSTVDRKSAILNGYSQENTNQVGTNNLVYEIDGECYRLNSIIATQRLKTFNNGQTVTIEEYIAIVENPNSPLYQQALGIFNSIFTSVDCPEEATQTIISSPECCAWYGFDYKIIKVDGKCFISCVYKEKDSDCLENQLIENELETTENNDYESYTIPYIDYGVNTGYLELQNPVGGTQQYYTTEIFSDCFEEASIVKWVVGNSVITPPVLNSLFEDPDFMNPNNWVVYTIDQYGRVSFTPATFESDFILDWNYGDAQLNDLYKDIAETLGYTFGTFIYDSFNDTLIPYFGNDSNSTFNAAVDTDYFTCDLVNNVSLVFGSENESGFKLPKFPINETTGEVIEDCSCKIDFSFDYMLKYNTTDLINCAENQSCFPAIFCENTINNINCLNFVTFTNSEEESENLINNFTNNVPISPITDIKQPNTSLEADFISTQKPNIEVWQNTNILEPSIECCTAIGGEVISSTQIESVNANWVNTIKETYNDLLENIGNSGFTETLDFIPSPQLLSTIIELKDVFETLSILPEECFTFDISLDDCEIDYSCYITTQSICWLQIPIECALWTYLKTIYEKLISEIRRNLILGKEYLDDCEGEKGVTNGKYEGSVNIGKIDISSSKNGQELEEQYIKLTEQITIIDKEISKLNEDNNVIQKALSDVNNPVDCTIYSDKIKEIDTFDYNSHCNNIVYGSNTNDGSKQEEYEACISNKTLENQKLRVTYSSLLILCNDKNNLEQQLVQAEFENNLELINLLNSELYEVNVDINKLTTDLNSFVSFDETTQRSELLENDTQNTINRTAEILGVTTESITDVSGILSLTNSQKIELSIDLEKNKSLISNLSTKKSDTEQLSKNNRSDKATLETNTSELIGEIENETQVETDDCDVITPSNSGDTIDCCDRLYVDLLSSVGITLSINSKVLGKFNYSCYQSWCKELYNNYEQYEIDNNNYFNNYMDDLKINFKLFVSNNNQPTFSASTLTYLPYTQEVNPIWEWNPTNGYSGIILEGSDQEISLIKDSVFNYLSEQNVEYNSDLFEPNWNTFNFTIPECVCDDLRRLYPNKQFYFSIEVENYECNLCLLVDNIQINISDCETERLVSVNDCMVPQLSCVIDNKKSWVYYDDGVIKETVNPNGNCNTGTTTDFEVVRLGKEEERLWLDLEYRYTDYNINHSDLILNVKNTTFSIDPAKAIECDVFNYWKNIDCDNCPTKCLEDSKVFEDDDDFLFQDCNTYIFEDQSTEHSVVFSGEVLSSGYTLSFDDIETTGLTFSCSTYTDSLTQSVLSLKNKYYALTSDYIESLDATYYQLLDKGESLDNFYIQENNCGTDTIVINDNSSLNNLFGIITENYDGTISIFENYLYTGTTPYSGGILTEVLSGTGVTAQTYNQKLHIDQDCCESLNDLLNGEGVGGLGLGKNYQWDTTNCFCTWKPLDDCDKCKGDCEYCGQKKECVDGFATGETYSVCINPLDYLDIQPSEIDIKAVFDQLVQTNLIDVKSRQTISDYPLLRLFYDLYLNASNCGKDLSGKFTYNTMFEFMDKIGDYWLDLIEQVVPATTIWEGCDNSGKIYRNTIFDNNKFNYKRYSTNFIDVSDSCPLSAQTDFSIGSENTYTSVEQKPIYPANAEITDIKTQILNKEVEIALLKKEIDIENSKLCALRLQDLSVPNLNNSIVQQEGVIDTLNVQLVELNLELVDLKTELSDLENDYLEKQKNYTMNFMSCSGITQSLVNAQNNLSGFTEGTISYEKQRNFIAGLRNKYYKCVRESSTLISNYNTIFLTQIYDSNEYEGNVTIIGDDDWESCSIKTTDVSEATCSYSDDDTIYYKDGPFYNKELIHNCDN